MVGSLANRLMAHDSPPHGLWAPPEPVARVLRARWEELSRDAARNDRVSDLHAARGDVWAVFEGYLDVYKARLGFLKLAERLNGRDRRARDAREALAREVDELVRLRDSIFQDWTTEDDLAEKLVEAFPLSAEQLKAAVARFPAPQAWYDQTDDPFQPEG